ncbi:MAG: response regulator transcription factor [Nitrospira sp.]|jgi:two-component system response regulator DevR|nr:response regulator transcription factor [Nitrospira sp.]
MKHTRTTILIVDDHEVVRQGLRTLLSLEQDLHIVGDASTVAEALTETARLRPHVVLLDMKLPDGTGPEACSRLLALAPDTRILMLTSFAEEAMVVSAVQSGVHGYLLKDVRATDLVQAIRTIAGGQSYLDPRVAQQALSWIRHQNKPDHPTPPQGLEQLSPQERAILPLLAEGKTNKEIAARLRLSDKTIKNYLAHIFDKLQVSRRTEAVAWYIKMSRSSPIDQIS